MNLKLRFSTESQREHFDWEHKSIQKEYQKENIKKRVSNGHSLMTECVDYWSNRIESIGKNKKSACYSEITEIENPVSWTASRPLRSSCYSLLD